MLGVSRPQDCAAQSRVARGEVRAEHDCDGIVEVCVLAKLIEPCFGDRETKDRCASSAESDRQSLCRVIVAKDLLAAQVCLSADGELVAVVGYSFRHEQADEKA